MKTATWKVTFTDGTHLRISADRVTYNEITHTYTFYVDDKASHIIADPKITHVKCYPKSVTVHA